MKLGKLPPTRDDRDIQYSALRTGPLIPRAPARFGHTYLPSKRPWEPLGNLNYGCCVFSMMAHQVMLWNEIAGRKVSFTDDNILSDYSAVTGFDPNDPNTDNGTVMRDALVYWKNVGIVDSANERHKIDAFVSIEPGNWDHMMEALYLFDSVALGIEVTQDAMDRFDQNDIWDLERRPSAHLGGHAIPIVSQYNFTNNVTWGRPQGMTKRFVTAKCDEAWAVLSSEALNNGRSEDGFDRAALLSYLKALKK